MMPNEIVSIEDRQRKFDDRTRNQRGIVYFSHGDENMLDNFGNRAARPVDLYKQFFPVIREKCGLPADAKFIWSQRAGCSCGCSPGFVCTELRGRDVFVHVKGIPTTGNDPDANALAEMRKEGLARQLARESITAKELKSRTELEQDAEYVEQLEVMLSR